MLCSEAQYPHQYLQRTQTVGAVLESNFRLLQHSQGCSKGQCVCVLQPCGVLISKSASLTTLNCFQTVKYQGSHVYKKHIPRAQLVLKGMGLAAQCSACSTYCSKAHTQTFQSCQERKVYKCCFADRYFLKKKKYRFKENLREKGL